MTKRKVSREIPLSEITLRKYEKPYDLPRRELIKKLCLSIGLLQPGDSRDIIVDILYVLLDSKKVIDSVEIQKKVIILRKKSKLPLIGITPSNMRRQIKRLRDIFLVEKVKNDYRITENEKLLTLFEEKIEKYHLSSIVERVRDYFKAI